MIKTLRRARKAAKSATNANHQHRESTMFRRSLGAIGLAAALVTSFIGDAAAQTACPFRGSLDEAYCDANRDMVADAPTDAARLLDYLGQCVGRRVVYFQVTSNAAQVEAMRSGRLHIAGFSTGPTAFAVNLAGAVPFAIKGNPDAFESYRVVTLVRADSPFQSLADLKGKRVAHTSATSNSGNLAPRAFFPGLGLTPDTDYRVVYSGGHDRSVMGVNAGDYDAAPVASDVFNRMVARGQVRRDNFRIIWESDPFPTSSFALSHDLKPELAERIRKCFFDYRFPEALRRDLGGNDRFWPATYSEHWAPVRAVADAVNAPYNRAAFDAESRRELEAEQRRNQQRQQQQQQQQAPARPQ
jgi:phosphonate transport system substrate-binding protein